LAPPIVRAIAANLSDDPKRRGLRRRIAAVRVLEGLGYAYQGGQWVPPVATNWGNARPARRRHARLIETLNLVTSQQYLCTSVLGGLHPVYQRAA
jgi:hypothetical protein